MGALSHDGSRPTARASAVHTRELLSRRGRATLPFIAANVAATAGQEAYVLLTVEGAWLATHGYADDMHHEGMPALRPRST